LLANAESGTAEGQLGSVYGLITNIQALIKVAVENAKKEEREKGKHLKKKKLFWQLPRKKRLKCYPWGAVRMRKNERTRDS
jgi:hypothetical protein